MAITGQGHDSQDNLDLDYTTPRWMLVKNIGSTQLPVPYMDGYRGMLGPLCEAVILLDDTKSRETWNSVYRWSAEGKLRVMAVWFRVPSAGEVGRAQLQHLMDAGEAVHPQEIYDRARAAMRMPSVTESSDAAERRILGGDRTPAQRMMDEHPGVAPDVETRDAIENQVTFTAPVIDPHSGVTRTVMQSGRHWVDVEDGTRYIFRDNVLYPIMGPCEDPEAALGAPVYESFGQWAARARDPRALSREYVLRGLGVPSEFLRPELGEPRPPEPPKPRAARRRVDKGARLDD